MDSSLEVALLTLQLHRVRAENLRRIIEDILSSDTRAIDFRQGLQRALQRALDNDTRICNAGVFGYAKDPAKASENKGSPVYPNRVDSGMEE